MELQGKVALVTGAGSGIGRAAALRLAAEGALVGVLGHGEEDLRETCRLIDADGGRALALPADVTDDTAMRAAVTELAAAEMRLDIVLANAGINGVWAPLEEIAPDEWDRTLSVNLTGTFLTLRHCIPVLKRVGGGAIVVTASINGTRSFSNTGATAYSVSKAGQVAMVKMLAPELGLAGIRINAICPGAIESEISDNTERRDLEAVRLPVEFPEGDIPLTGRRKGKAEDVADLVLFLASDRARHITGTEVYVDGGQSLVRG